jgi:membrane protease YdiL (CAAX protease family)
MTQATFKTAAKAFGLAAIVSVAITAYGQGLWGPLVVANLRLSPGVPWAAPIMAALLAGLILHLSGRGWPKATSTTRRRLLRWNAMPWSTFFLAIGAGILALAAFGGLWIAASDLVHIPPGIQPKMTGVPLGSAIAFLAMSSLAAPLSEEAAFRGYAMGLLEKAWNNAPAAIVGSSILSAAVHVLQGIDPVKLSLYFAAGLIFATIAWLTNSLYAAMVVHSAGDVIGFTVLWPHDQQPHAMGFGDPLFVPAIAALVVLTPLAILAFAKLAKAGAPLRTRRCERPLMPTAVAA